MKKYVLTLIILFTPLLYSQSSVNAGTGAAIDIGAGSDISAGSRSGKFTGNGTFNGSPLTVDQIKLTTNPAQFSLSQNYPNPFNPTTTIQYVIPKAEHVTLKVYDEVGRKVATLVDELQQPGSYSIQFYSRQPTTDRRLASGVYLYRLTAGNFTEAKKLVLLK